MLKVRRKDSVITNMINLKNLQTHNGIRKVCALVAATMILPMLAYGDHDSERWNEGDNAKHQSWGEKDQDRDKDRDSHIPSVPDGGSGIVLLTTAIGAVLLFGATQRSRVKT
jgi:hypothetical protein